MLLRAAMLTGVLDVEMNEIDSDSGGLLSAQRGAQVPAPDSHVAGIMMQDECFCRGI